MVIVGAALVSVLVFEDEAGGGEFFVFGGGGTGVLAGGGAGAFGGSTARGFGVGVGLGLGCNRFWGFGGATTLSR